MEKDIAKVMGWFARKYRESIDDKERAEIDEFAYIFIHRATEIPDQDEYKELYKVLKAKEKA